MTITIDHVSKRFGRNVTALDDVSFEIQSGLFGLIGRNGAGKTTLMRIMATIYDATDGNVLIDGEPITRHLKQYRKMLGYLPQNTQLMPYLDLEEFLDYSCVINGISNPKTRKSEIARCMEIVGLENEGKKRLAKYSGGMLRRAGIAQALLGDPKLLIIDEPTTGLDPEERLYFLNLLSKMSVDKTIVFSTHIIQDIENICKNIAILERGKLMYTGNIHGLLETLRGKTFGVTVAPGEEAALREKAVVTSVTYINNLPYVRYICDEAIHADSEVVVPTLEDACIYTLGGVKR
ncbi:MAG: ATP-binding cassette domain-containing protein [Ruminococcaceae bacterium]|nr:ATP-binding cassette domain-containing protein [Oscillospiraceae bacterium]